MADNITSTSTYSDDFSDIFGEEESIDDDVAVLSDDHLKELMKINYSYPETDDDDFQEKVYKKREYYYNHIPKRPKLETYEMIKEYRDKLHEHHGLLPQQAFLSNYINPDTPYRGVLIFHGTGVGKCLLYDELVYTNGTLKRIGELWDTESTDILYNNEEQWSIPKHKILINSYDESTGKIIIKNVEKLYRQYIDETIREITLDNGMKINMTKAHKLLKQNGWENNLNVGDYISIPNVLYNTSSANTFVVTKELANLLAWQISEGHENSKYNLVAITNTEIDVLNKLKENIKCVSSQYNINFNNYGISYPKNRVTYLRITSKEYKLFLESNGYKFGNLSANKTIPEFIMKFVYIKLVCFRRRLLDLFQF